MSGANSPLRLHLALGLISVAVVALQLVLMQILAITQWHHFAYMVISLALLGFGASGTLIALCRGWLLSRMDRLLPLLLFASAATMASVTSATQRLFGGFDSYLLFFDPSQIGRLLLVNLLFTVPFFLGALAIGLILVQHVERIGSLYFANLLGSGLGGLAGIAALSLLFPERLPALIALFALASGLTLVKSGDRIQLIAAATCAAVIAVFLLQPPSLTLSQYKDLRGVLELPEAQIVASRPGPLGLVQIVSAPTLRHAPGLSLNYRGEVPVRDLVFNNGNSFGPVPLWPPADAPPDQSTAAFPYAFGPPGSVLVLHAATGDTAARALGNGASRVTLVEPHLDALELLREIYPGSAGRLLNHRSVDVQGMEPRAFLATTKEKFDLILLPSVGAFGGTAGLFALQEEYSLTVEGIGALWQHLAADGMLCLPVWFDYPPRNPLRLAATLIEALRTQGIDAPQHHLAAVNSWGDLGFCLKRSPLSAGDLERIRAFAQEMQFDPLLPPDLRPQERHRYHALQDERFFTDLDRLFTPGAQQFLAEYPFRLRPATDDRPFFSQFLRWQSLPELARLFGERSIPFLEMGYLIVILTFCQMWVAAVVLILLPLLRLGWGGQERVRTLLYFGGLGAGYMLVEIDLIHRFVLYLGHPVYAASAVICALLVFSGIGSQASTYIAPKGRTRQLAAATVVLLLILYSLLLPPLIELSIALPLLWKTLLAIVFIAPLGLAMGLPFPLGLRALSLENEPLVPWAWGINGCLSVLSTSLATIIAVEAGFTALFLVAAAAYGTAALSGGRN